MDIIIMKGIVLCYFNNVMSVRLLQADLVGIFSFYYKVGNLCSAIAE